MCLFIRCLIVRRTVVQWRSSPHCWRNPYDCSGCEYVFHVKRRSQLRVHVKHSGSAQLGSCSTGSGAASGLFPGYGRFRRCDPSCAGRQVDDGALNMPSRSLGTFAPASLRAYEPTHQRAYAPTRLGAYEPTSLRANAPASRGARGSRAREPRAS